MKTLYLGLVTIVLLGSCTKAIIDEGNVNELQPITRTVTFSEDIQPIMFNYCVTCHGGNAPRQGVALENYSDVRFYTENGNLKDRMNNQSNPMPPNGLVSSKQRQLIDKWIQDGFPQ